MEYCLEEKICILFGEYGVTAKKYFHLKNLFESAQDFVEGIQSSTEAEKILGEQYSKLVRALKSGAVDKIINKMNENGVTAVTHVSSAFPETLRYIDDPPYALFCKGDVNLLKTRCLAVVGTRKASSYGRRVAKDFTAILCEYFTIVSGLAYGVDSIAHETTLTEGGKTIAVLGGGLINVYPSANQGLADRIVNSGGLLISEYGLDAQPFSYRFPHRNRLVSGLSQGLLVCQAPLKSGTSSTVELALDQGKDVFAVPGEIYDAGFGGSNHLIKTMQGACVTTPRDIVGFYNLDLKKEKTAESYQLSIDEQKIVDALSVEAKTFDQLVESTLTPPSELYFLLANLELKSIIAKLPGNLYRLYGGIK